MLAINISLLTPYILYVISPFTSIIQGPGTVLLTVASSFRTVFTSLTLAESYTLAVAPAIFYLIICLKTKADTQVFVGALMSSVYAMIMTMVLVATIAQFTTSDEITSSSFFFIFMIGLFLITGLLHPQEMMCLLYGLLYLVTLPGGYVLLVIYSICNLHVVSWGTREVAPKTAKKKKKKGKGQKEVKEEAPKPKPKPKGFLAKLLGIEGDKGVFESIAGFFTTMSSSKNARQEQLLLEICNKLENLNAEKKCEKSGDKNKSMDMTIMDQNNKTSEQTDLSVDSEVSEVEVPRNDLYNPFWIDLKILGDNDIYYLNTKEMTFWQGNFESCLKYCLKLLTKF